ncbi:glycosyltransferase [Gryllotalpicola koreensis]|uniref:4,4'-diaponeurosporenoate glycosyltransferase n=1 Tax=Gryllotalpicola koreensis TaxID=993086 RepID=A0ABP7ZPD6_9MICO
MSLAQTIADPRSAQRRPASASVIIPAHNEAAVIERTLRPLARAAAAGELEVIVVCNGCHDETAAVAASVPGVIVIETEIASKPHALNLGDARASAWPRVYLDADIVADESSVRGVALWLSLNDGFAARPTAEYELGSASWPVRAYYRARSRVPSLHEAMWGAGIYALSHAAHERLGSFPEVVGDDLWVDRLFDPDEKAIVTGAPVIVQTPRTLAALLAVTRRAVRGAAAAGPSGRSASTTGGTLSGIARSVRGPATAFDAAVYLAVALLARASRASLGAKRGWERDDSSR